jgi:hypothetical protein
MSGETGEDFVDMIIDSNGLYFMCIKSHEKSSQIIPTNASYFRAAQKIEVVAAYAVLARTIIMTDADNNVVFRAENGDVECTQGNFKNVKVEGAITASTLDLKSDESAMIVSPGDTVTLPALEEGYARRVLIIINRMMRNTNYPITVKGADGVFIDKPKWYADSSVAAVYHTSQQYASDGGCDYEAVGFNYKGSTYWAIYKLSDAESAVS